jgi:hypothetical protein
MCPAGSFLQPPQAVEEANLVVVPSPDFQSITFNMTSPVVGRSNRTVTLFSKTLPRKEAEAACRRQGGELFVATHPLDICRVSNAAAKAMSMLGLSSMSDMWLGAIKRANSTEWTWGTSALAEQGMSLGTLEPGVAPWTPGEPNGRPDEEVCLEMKVRSNLQFSAWLNDQGHLGRCNGCSDSRAYACSSTWW